jgi:hypothetical protein
MGGRRRYPFKGESISGGFISWLSDVNVIMIIIANLRGPALPSCFYEQISYQDILDDDFCLSRHSIKVRD